MFRRYVDRNVSKKDGTGGAALGKGGVVGAGLNSLGSRALDDDELLKGGVTGTLSPICGSISN